MAGSPAAGKTELLNRLIEQNGLTNFVRIDADDFRWWFPYYNEKNARDYQKPASGMVEKTYKHALTDGYPIIMDSTFASPGIADKNFDRAFEAGYKVMLNYVYFEPALAWQYAQTRTRQVPLDVLKKNFIKSSETIEHVLNKYHGCFTLNVIQRRPDPNNQGQFIIDYKSGVTKDSWVDSHDCPYTVIEDLAHIGV
ncbi:zeta toxin family protein [Serratia silvae]